MYITKLLKNDTKAIVNTSSTSYIPSNCSPDAPRVTEYSQTTIGTFQYQKSLQRAFNVAKQHIYFNDDMTYFVTLTYKGTDHTTDDVLHHLKMFMKNQRRKGYKPKYIAIMEYQKRGSIHVHMITNNELNYQLNDNGYNHLPDWSHGFSSVLTIKDFDSNFRPYLYLFKYMRKSQRLGRSFIYCSRNLRNYQQMSPESFDVFLYTQIAQEKYTYTTPDGLDLTYSRNYYKLNSQIK